MIAGKVAQCVVQGVGVPGSPIVKCFPPVTRVFCVIQSHHTIQECDAYPGTNLCFGNQSPLFFLKKKHAKTRDNGNIIHYVLPVIAFVHAIYQEYKER